MASILYLRPDYISQIQSNGFAPLGYSLNDTLGSAYKRCVEQFPIISAASQGVITLPNRAKFDPHQTYDAPVSMAPFTITWTIFAQPGTSESNFNTYVGGDIGDLMDYPKYRVRVYATDLSNGNMWYLNTRCTGLRVQYGAPFLIARPTISLDPYSNEWQQGGPGSAT